MAHGFDLHARFGAVIGLPAAAPPVVAAFRASRDGGSTQASNGPMLHSGCRWFHSVTSARTTAVTTTPFASLLGRGALVLAACLTSSAALAQTISVTPNNQTTLGVHQGQSFQATVTGTITAISVQSAGGPDNVTLRLYNGANGSGQFNAVGTPVYSQAGITLVFVPAGTWQTITLTTPFPVVAGSSYSFILESQSTLRNGGNTYPNGTRFDAFGLSIATADLAFQIFESAAVPVPTLSEWALILLAGSLGLAGYAAVWQRHRA